MDKIKFLHCADLHLGINSYDNEIRYYDYFSAFQKVVDYAIEKEVDFILISGDMFDHKNIRPKTLVNTTKILKELKEHNIPVYATVGNHDRSIVLDRVTWMSYLSYEGFLNLLDLSYIDDSKIELNKWDDVKKSGTFIDKEKYRIWGLGYLGGGIESYLTEIGEKIKEITENEGEKVNIILLHAGLKGHMANIHGGVSKEALSSIERFTTYLALGHIHSKHEMDGWIFNPGTLESTDNKEFDYQRGFFEVEIDLDEKKIIFLNHNLYKGREIYIEKFDISQCQSPEVIFNFLQDKLEKIVIKKDSIIDITLYGKVPFNGFDIELKKLKNYIKKLTSALIVLININTDSNEIAIDTSKSLDEIERDVIKYLVSKGNYKNIEDMLVDFIFELKDSLKTGLTDEDICERVLNLKKSL